jgi:hypothetical protein
LFYITFHQHLAEEEITLERDPDGDEHANLVEYFETYFLSDEVTEGDPKAICSGI